VAVAALLGQEHHTRGQAWTDLKASAKHAGWQMTGAKGGKGDKGTTVTCTLVAVRRGHSTGQTKDPKEDCSPTESPGRCSSVWVDGIVRGGVLLVSVYLWHEEGLTTRNRAILYAAGDAIRRHGGPWILVGDFNTTPNDVKHSMGKWLERIGGEVCAPGNLTCKNGRGGGRTIDFFIVDSRISHGVQGTWC